MEHDLFTAARAELRALKPGAKGRTRASATGARGPKARVYAFPIARHRQTLERTLDAYLALFAEHGYATAAKLFETKLGDPIRKRLRAAGLNEREISKEMGAFKVALKDLYDHRNPQLNGASA